MKAVLVMDMPENCGACKLSSGDGFHLICPFSSRGIEAYIKNRYKGCPLQELPEKWSGIELDSMQDYERARAEGYNYCIENIVK